MERKTLLIGVLCFVSSLANAQTPPELKIDKVRAVTGLLSPISLLLPVKCNSERIYLRLYERDFPERKIIRVAADGTSFGNISPTAVEGMKEAAIVDFAPDPEGGLHVLVARSVKQSTEYYLLSFDSEGNFRSKLQLDVPFRPEQILRFASGTFLMAGQEKHTTKEGVTAEGGKAYIGLFDRNGRLIRRLSLKGDLEPPKEGRSKSDGTSVADYDSTMMTSMLELGDDGNADLLRPDGTMFIVSPGGEVRMILRPKPPEGAFLLSAKLGRATAVFVYGKRKPPGEDGISRGIQAQYFLVYDTTSGEQMAQYWSSDPALGAALACYSPDSFVFVRPGRRGLLDVISAVPER